MSRMLLYMYAIIASLRLRLICPTAPQFYSKQGVEGWVNITKLWGACGYRITYTSYLHDVVLPFKHFLVP